MAEEHQSTPQLTSSSDEVSEQPLLDPTVTGNHDHHHQEGEGQPTLTIGSKLETEQPLSNRTTPTSPHHLTIINPAAGTVSSSESISEDEYLERLHEKYSQTPSSELGISSFSTFGSMNTTYFHTETSVSSESTLTPKKSEDLSVNNDFIVDLCYQSTDSGSNICGLDEIIKSPEDDEALDLLVGTGTTQHSSEPTVATLDAAMVDDELLRSTSQPPKVPPPFNSKKSQFEAEKMEMSKFHLPPVPAFKKKPPPLQTHQSRNIISIATPSPPSSLKLILQQYNILHHTVVHLTLNNKNQKIIVPMINSNVIVLARSASLSSSLTNIFEDKVPVKVFQNENGNDDLYLSTQSGNQRITALELDCKNPALCLKSLEDILFVTTVLPLSNFQVEEVAISNSTTQSVHHFHKVRAKDPQESQVIIFATDTHIEIPLTANDEFIIEDIGRLTAFEESISVCPHGEHYMVRGPGVFWLKTEIII